MKRPAFFIGVLMLASSIGAFVAKPSTKVADQMAGVRLEEMVPRQFGDWQEVQQARAQVVNPQTQELLDRIYSQILSRSYVDGNGYLVMLSIAFGSDQRGALQAHKPEVCYPAQGFMLDKVERGVLASRFGEIEVTRLTTSLQSRREPVTYWFTMGDRTVGSRLERRLVEMRYGLTGQIPDGLLFRVSSIDPDPERAYRTQERFVEALLASIPASSRVRLSGLRGSE